MLPNSILKEISMYLAQEMQKEIYEVKIENLDDRYATESCQNIHFKRKEDAIKFLNHSSYFQTGETYYCTSNFIQIRKVANNLDHAFDMLDQGKCTERNRLECGVFMERGEFDLRDFGKKVKTLINDTNKAKDLRNESLVAIKKAKNE